MRYTHNAFDMSYKATIGVDFEVEKYSILDIPFTLQMWDTGNVLQSVLPDGRLSEYTTRQTWIPICVNQEFYYAANYFSNRL